MDSSWEGTSSHLYQEEWVKVQDMLKQKLVLEDDFTWTISPQGSCLDQVSEVERLQYIGGVDVSFVKEDPSLACGALVILDASTLNVVHEEFEVVRLKVPYAPGFLAFREAPMVLRILDKMKQNSHPFYPQLLMVDGNGILHPRGFGLACHLGVLANLPAIGIGKNLHHVDGLTQSGVRKLLEARENIAKDIISLVGKSGHTWGVAMRSTPGSLKPIYISSGHRISLDSSIKIVKSCCKFRVPEPIRQADIRSRKFLQELKGSGHIFNEGMVVGILTGLKDQHSSGMTYLILAAAMRATLFMLLFTMALVIISFLTHETFVHLCSLQEGKELEDDYGELRPSPVTDPDIQPAPIPHI